MKITESTLVRTLALAGLILALIAVTGWATDGRGDRPVAPTLARLSFWVPPARMSEFEAAYRAKVVPILKAHGLTESSERGRATPDSVFSRLFELKMPGEVEEKQKTLQEDTAWQAVLRSLGTAFGTNQPDSLIRHNLILYAAPAGQGRVVPAGPGGVVPAGPGRGRWRIYDTSDGLVDVTVQSILQDREGNLWFGTGSGVSRYDGNTWTTFTTRDGLADNRMRSILQDREGNLWFGTDSGVSRYDGNTWTTFTTRDGLADNRVWSILQDREGHFWFGTRGGVSRYNGNIWTTFTTKDGLVGNWVRSILQDREGHFWFGAGAGVNRYDGQTWTTFTAKDGLSAGNWVNSIFQDRKGNLWFVTGGGLSRYDGQIWTMFTEKDGLASRWVNSIFQDREGHLWFGTQGGGVSRYDPSATRLVAPTRSQPSSLLRTGPSTGSGGTGLSFTTFTTEDGLADTFVNSIFQDREGHLWFGTESGGVSRFDSNIWTTFTAKDGLGGNLVRSIFQDREGHLWFGTQRRGVSRYDGQRWTTFTTKDGLGDNLVWSIFQDREGHLWFGTQGGVSLYDGQTWTTYTTQDGLADNSVRSVLQDREGHLWFGTSAGVSRFDGQRFTTFTAEDGLAKGLVWPTFQDREGNLWFGTVGGGVSRYDGQTWKTLTTHDGLAHNVITSILQDREGIFWFGTVSGVSRYDGKSFTVFTTQDGLAHNEVRSILQDREGHLWFGTWSGVSRYDGQGFQTLTYRDGLASNRVYSILQDREGQFWFGTTGGVTRFRPPAPSPLPAFIDAVVADRRYEKVSELAIPSSAGLTVFEFHGINFKTRPEQMVYRYRLSGYDKDWRATHNRRVEYQNIPRGNYTFEVVAVDRDLVYSEKPATVTLRVHPPYMLIGLWSALSIAVALVAWQTARVIRRDRRLQEANAALSSANKELFQANIHIQEQTQRKSAFLASMSHELRTPMNAIKGFTSLVLRREPSLTERGKQNLEKVGQASDHLLAMINDLLDLSKIEAGRMDVNPERFDVRALVASCCDTVSPLFLTKGGVELRQEVAPDVGQAHTDGARLRQMLVNLLSNAIKFTDAGSVTVRASQRDGHLVLAVSDTGKGIPAEHLATIFDEYRQVKGQSESAVQRGTGLGLSITKRFAELLGGTIGVESEVGKGSTFTVRVPLVYQGN